LSFFTHLRRLPALSWAAPREEGAPGEPGDGATGPRTEEPDGGRAPEPAGEGGTGPRTEDPAGARVGEPAGDGSAGPRLIRRVAAWAVTVAACLLVLYALIAPNQLSRLTPAAFVRLPVEALVGVALVLVLPWRAGRVVAAVAGAVLGALTILKILDMGFYEALDRPFDPVLDWTLLADGVDFLTRSLGRLGATGCVIAVVGLAVGLLVAMTRSALRLARLAVTHRTPAKRGAAVLAVAWVTCAALGVQILPGVPLAAASATALTYDRLRAVRAGLQDERAFAATAGVDALRDTPGRELLTGLRGTDVVVAFVESYGRVAIEDRQLAPQVTAVLDAGNRRLRAAGFASRSAFLTSPTAGGGSWLAHSTLLSGLWIDNEQRYRNLLASDRLTLNGAFRRAGWRTVGVMPAVTRSWPEGAFYGYDRLYTARDLGYQGPLFNFASMPDQYTLSAFQRSERANPDHAPVMAEIVLLSSHSPWTPLPRLVDWGAVGNGSVFAGMPATGDAPEVVARDRDRVRTAYRQSIEYSLSALISYVLTYGDDHLVLVFLGDHQPAPLVAGPGASRDVPITIVAHDPAVLDRISGWGWQDGLMPGPNAPVWRMDRFRDRFLTAFGPQAGPTPSPSPSTR
jgi:hypothetical protein